MNTSDKYTTIRIPTVWHSILKEESGQTHVPIVKIVELALTKYFGEQE